MVSPPRRLNRSIIFTQKTKETNMASAETDRWTTIVGLITLAMGPIFSGCLSRSTEPESDVTIETEAEDEAPTPSVDGITFGSDDAPCGIVFVPQINMDRTSWTTQAEALTGDDDSGSRSIPTRTARRRFAVRWSASGRPSASNMSSSSGRASAAKQRSSPQQRPVVMSTGWSRFPPAADRPRVGYFGAIAVRRGRGRRRAIRRDDATAPRECARADTTRGVAG